MFDCCTPRCRHCADMARFSIKKHWWDGLSILFYANRCKNNCGINPFSFKAGNLSPYHFHRRSCDEKNQAIHQHAWYNFRFSVNWLYKMRRIKIRPSLMAVQSSSETLFKPKFREISFAHNLFLSYPIVFKILQRARQYHYRALCNI